VGELNVAETWQLQAFEGENVTFLEPDGDGLLIGTGEGLFHLNDGQFFNLGLKEYELRGAVRLKGDDLLAAVRTPDFSSGDVTIFKRRDGQSSWEPFLNDYGGEEKNTFIFTLKSLTPISDTLIATASGPLIARSINGGKSWKVMNGHKWGGYGGLGALNSPDTLHKRNVWAGGVSGISSARLLKSTDYGETWKNVTAGLSNGTEAVAYDVISDINDPGLVLVGLGGSFAAANNVKKSNDGGETWETALAETGIHAFARSITNPEVIYAGGRDASTKLFFAFTTDFGETWEKEIFGEGPSVITTNDLEVLMIDGKEVLFLATDQGLFSYTLEN
ncbi:MAG TPA: hypothetical protein VKM36_07225, partial [Balneolaceae bacterium]|nr:hypothetical protein [Balneolaceae bacterium]